MNNIMNRQKQRYVLIKWISGKHSGTTTHNVQVEWIKGFEEDDIDFVNSYVIEWRVPPKPAKGWHFYDGQILEVSGE